ncbi:MAG: DUF2341 domain-containing protein [Deltaproteobacteria bacterium]|nr:DUF2341 domain-containing protein [Deltaproteobacteria bacterium]
MRGRWSAFASCAASIALLFGCRLDATGAGPDLPLPIDASETTDTFVEPPVDTAIAIDDTTVDDVTTLDTTSPDASPTDWPAKGWSYRRRLEIDGAMLDGELTHFVVPVVFTDADMISKVAIDGRDLRFTRLDGSLLPFELVRWDPAGGNIVAWVQLPVIGPALPNAFHLYYGNAAATSAADAKKTWSSEVAVWHFDEAAINGDTTATFADATGGGHHGWQNGSESAPGVILGGQRFDGKDAVEVQRAHDIVLGDVDCTFAAWIRTTEAKQQGILIRAKGETHEVGDKLIGTGKEGPHFGVDHGWVGFLRTAVAINDGKWHHVAWVQQKDAKDKLETWRLYVDGVELAIRQYETKPDVTTHTVRIGARAASSYFDNPWTGDLDELRYAKVARSGPWIAALERSQRAPESFVKVGPEETAK